MLSSAIFLTHFLFVQQSNLDLFEYLITLPPKIEPLFFMWIIVRRVFGHIQHDLMWARLSERKSGEKEKNMEKENAQFSPHISKAQRWIAFLILLIRMWLKSALQGSFSSQFIVNRPTAICTRASAEYWESRANRSWKTLSFFFHYYFVCWEENSNFSLSVVFFPVWFSADDSDTLKLNFRSSQVSIGFLWKIPKFSCGSEDNFFQAHRRTGSLVRKITLPK